MDMSSPTSLGFVLDKSATLLQLFPLVSRRLLKTFHHLDCRSTTRRDWGYGPHMELGATMDEEFWMILDSLHWHQLTAKEALEEIGRAVLQRLYQSKWTPVEIVLTNGDRWFVGCEWDTIRKLSATGRVHARQNFCGFEGQRKVY